MKPPAAVGLAIFCFVAGFVFGMAVFRHEAETPPKLLDLWERVRAIESAEELEQRVRHLEARKARKP